MQYLIAMIGGALIAVGLCSYPPIRSALRPPAVGAYFFYSGKVLSMGPDTVTVALSAGDKATTQATFTHTRKTVWVEREATVKAGIVEKMSIAHTVGTPLFQNGDTITLLLLNDAANTLSADMIMHTTVRKEATAL